MQQVALGSRSYRLVSEGFHFVLQLFELTKMSNRLMIIRQGYLHYFVENNVIVVPKNVTNDSSSLLYRSFILEPMGYFH